MNIYKTDVGRDDLQTSSENLTLHLNDLFWSEGN